MSGYGVDGIYRSTLDGHQRMVLPCHPHQSFPAFLFKGEVGDPSRASKPLLIDASSGAAITCAEFRRLVTVVGAGLSSVLGVKQGDVILILLSNTIYFPVIFHAILSIGAIATTANPASPSDDIRRQISDSSAKFAITMPDLAPKISTFSGRTVLINSNGLNLNPNSVIFDKLLSTDPALLPRVRIRLGDSAAILYSSGTTGRSKGVILSHGNLIAAIASVNATKDEEKQSDDHVAFVILPMFHIAGLVWLGCSAIRAAVTLVVLRKFDFIDMLEAIQRYKVTNLPLVPPLVVAFNKHPSVAKYDLSSLRRAASGAAPLKKDTIEFFLKKFPQIEEFNQGYGMTETTGLGAAGWDAPFGASGRLMPMLEALVIDVDTGKPLPPNHRGELWLRGPSIMQAYLNNPQATVEAIDDEGWLRTGDLVYFDDNGFIYIVDRLKELIKFKGFQVPPAELEALLLTHPSIADAAVIPFPDEDAGEIPFAFVVRVDKSLTEANVMNFVAEKVAPYKKVRRVAFVDVIPKSTAGKILRKDLVKLAQSKL